MDFGKNRVQYIDFYWQYFRYKKLDTYFYVGGSELAKYCGKYANKKIIEIEYFFEYSLDKRIVFIVYNKHSDFRQSNIGLITGKDQYNIGGLTNIVNNKVFLYYEGDHRKLERQIDASITEVLLNEMLYGSDIKDKMASSTLLNLPDWYVKGLISFVSNKYDINIENHIKDAVLSGRYKKFNRLEGKEAVYAGHAIWKYITDIYGEGVIPNILYLTRISKNIDNGFLYVLGVPLKELTDEWLIYCKSKYEETDNICNLPEETPILKRSKKRRVYQQIKISPNSNFIAFTTNENGQYKVWLYDTQTKKIKKIFKREHKLEQITDYSYPILAWHPSGEILAIITERKGKILLTYYIMETKKLQTRELFYIEKILDFNYSPDGSEMVFSGIKNGQTDIFIHSIAANANRQITKDLADDINPRFINLPDEDAANSYKIIFSSNRKTDSIIFEKKEHFETQNTYDIFVYDYKSKSKKLARLSETPYVTDKYPYGASKFNYIYLSDENGIINRHLLAYDSTISFVDTSIHYRYVTKNFPLTNYSRNINEQDININTNNYAEILYYNGKYSMYFNELRTDKNIYYGDYKNSEFRKKLTEKLKIEENDSISEEHKLIAETPKIDSIIISPKPIMIYDKSITDIDINNYVFEIEKKGEYYSELNYIDTSLYLSDKEKEEPKFPRQMVYFTNFYTNYVVNQIDFGFLNESYQVFTGGAVYFNPGFNVYSKIGATDLFEDYKITAGFRFSGNFNSNEYLISVENLKNRFDKQYIFHRQAYENYGQDFLAKTHAQQLMFLLKYPIDQVSSLRLTTSLRYDRTVFLSTDYKNLGRDNLLGIWAGIKMEYVYDNTKSLGLNLFDGTRMKVFGEYYKQIDKELNQNLYVIGTDVRNYQRIHRCLIWANRFATSTSFGNSLLIYYLGSTDNWINLSAKVPTFNNDIDIDRTKNYVYQTVATNMRGFSQNVRNGNSFALINSEIRWPFIRYFANRPINSDFLANLMFVGFFDAGSAWTGWSPYANRNAYNFEEVVLGNLTVIIDKNKDPFVAGYGFGLRSKLLGYFIRADWAWGIEKNEAKNKMFYISLSLDF